MLGKACSVLKNLSSIQDPVQVYAVFSDFNKLMENQYVA